MVENMSFKQKWRIYINSLEVVMRVGCAPHEREPQRIWLNVTIEGQYPVQPEVLEDCINYDLVYKFVTGTWPGLPHTILLETRMVELLEFIFASDAKVDYAKVAMLKPDIFKEVATIGLEAEWTREDYERLKGSKA